MSFKVVLLRINNSTFPKNPQRMHFVHIIAKKRRIFAKRKSTYHPDVNKK